MLKSKRVLIIIFCIMISMLFLIGREVEAMTPADIYACSRGVCVYYYIENGSSNTFYQRIKNAAYNWEHTGFGYNPIYLYERSSSSGTAIDFYNKSNSHFGATSNMIVLGHCKHYNGSGTYIPYDTGNWLYSEICLNKDKLPNQTTTKQQGTIAHEMGHSFGLHHYNTNPYSIMCQSYVSSTIQRQVETVQQEDNDAINYKYGS